MRACAAFPLPFLQTAYYISIRRHTFSCLCTTIDAANTINRNRWFTSQGVALKTEADGRMFPTTDSSQTIVDCLRKAAAEAGVRVETGAKARCVRPILSLVH